MEVEGKEKQQKKGGYGEAEGDLEVKPEKILLAFCFFPKLCLLGSQQ